MSLFFSTGFCKTGSDDKFQDMPKDHILELNPASVPKCHLPVKLFYLTFGCFFIIFYK